MSMKIERARQWLDKRSRKYKKLYPVATVAWYGPTDMHASKLAATVFRYEGDEDESMERWIRDDVDVRYDDQVTLEVVAWLKHHGVQRVGITERIIGCPHEEGIDYPVGEVCPECPFWANRDRFTGELYDDTANEEESRDDPDDVELIHSQHCRPFVRDGVTLKVEIYKVPGEDWLLEVVNERGTSTVWDDLFETDDEAYAEFLQTIQDEGVEAFTQS